MRRLRARTGTGERGFTLIELMIAIALLGIGLAFITNMFLNGWRLWKRSYDELLLQRDTRDTMALMTRALREGKPGSIAIDSIGGNPLYSRIVFQDGRGQSWLFRQNGSVAEYVLTTAQGVSSTNFLMRNVTVLNFTFPNYRDFTLVDVSLVASKKPYSDARQPILIELVERVMLRNP